MHIRHRLVGYDRQTDRTRTRFDIPDHFMPDAKKIAKVPDDDPELAWSYPLTGAKTRRIARPADRSEPNDDSRHRASHRDCFVAPLLAMTAIWGVIASEAKQSR